MKNIKLAKELLKENYTDNVSVILFWTNVLNHYALIQSTFGELEAALEALTQSKDLHLKCKQNPEQNFLDYLQVFDSGDEENEKNIEKKIEKSYTETIYFMAQVLQSLGQDEQSARLCLETLKRQASSGDFDPLDWAVNAGTFCQYFASHDDFVTARHLLASSLVMIERVDSSQGESDLLNKRKHDLDRIFAKYCMMLMEGPTKSEAASTLDQVLEDPVVLEKEKSIPVLFPKTYEDALVIFSAGQQHLSSALEYFTLNEHASDHSDCIIDQSKLYRLLASFQSDPSKVCKLYKRRVDLLQSLLKELNPSFFLAYNRKINFELGEIFSEMIHYKTKEKASEAQANHNVKHTKQTINKINSFVLNSLTHFDNFFNTFLDKESKKIKGKLDDNDVRPVIVALLNQGRLYTQFLSPDPRDKLKHLSDSESCYQKAMDYITCYPDQEKLVEKEAEVLKEMIQLLPEKRKMMPK